MALILEGRATALECYGCGQLYLDGEGLNRSNPEAAADWRRRHEACPAPETILRAAAPAMQRDLEALILPRLLELGGEVAHAWNPLPAGAALVTEREAAVQRAAADVAGELIQKLELSLLPGRLEQAARRIAQTEEELSIVKAKLDEATERAGELEVLVEKATQLAETQAAVLEVRTKRVRELELAAGARGPSCPITPAAGYIAACLDAQDPQRRVEGRNEGCAEAGRCHEKLKAGRP
jgi:hypothetical protein